ncbi:hypothetical protein Syun_030686 [Stephania yunnanensis]|uniref:Uncharacterized protein n=1 Tax=Stephania yunnanensis TaxID=152371 RepID=A0AAP0DTY8_9MAGN
MGNERNARAIRGDQRKRNYGEIVGLHTRLGTLDTRRQDHLEEEKTQYKAGVVAAL